MRFFILTILLSLMCVPVAQANPAGPVEIFVADFTRHELRLSMESNASSLLSELNFAFTENREPELDASVVVSDFHHALKEMWRTSRFYIPDQRIIETASQLTNGFYEMRNIPVYFVDPDGEEHYEEAVIQFTPSGMVNEIRIGLPAHRYQQLMQEGQDEIDSQNRHMILSFVENFRTAYNRQDLEFIENVFSDQALIIVGRVVQNTGEQSPYEAQVEFLQYTKSEYIERLGRVFAANTWIDVGFEEIRIRRHPRIKEVYGISLTQYYNSSIYSDVGFLFLLIDFEDQQNPMIHVRTWQPKNETPETHVFQLGDMEIF